MTDTFDPRPKIDRIDRKILAALQRDGRITNTRMSEEVGLSATRCWERVKRLERSGVIRGYHADIDLRRLAKLSLYQARITLSNTTPTKAQMFERFIKGEDAVLSCHATLGNYDYILVVAAQDTESFQSVMDRILVEGCVDFEFVTSPVYKSVKSSTSSSIAALIGVGQDGGDS